MYQIIIKYILIIRNNISLYAWSNKCILGEHCNFFRYIKIHLLDNQNDWMIIYIYSMYILYMYVFIYVL